MKERPDHGVPLLPKLKPTQGSVLLRPPTRESWWCCLTGEGEMTHPSPISEFRPLLSPPHSSTSNVAPLSSQVQNPLHQTWRSTPRGSVTIPHPPDPSCWAPIASPEMLLLCNEAANRQQSRNAEITGKKKKEADGVQSKPLGLEYIADRSSPPYPLSFPILYQSSISGYSAGGCSHCTCPCPFPPLSSAPCQSGAYFPPPLPPFPSIGHQGQETR